MSSFAIVNSMHYAIYCNCRGVKLLPAAAIQAISRRTLSRSSGVSTPAGASSTAATAMCMPASRARSCSSLSDCSSGEGGSTAVEKVVASSGFLLVATMNPGGDYGKRELSPALRNRFTEIYVPAIMSEEDLSAIALHHVV